MQTHFWRTIGPKVVLFLPKTTLLLCTKVLRVKNTNIEYTSYAYSCVLNLALVQKRGSDIDMNNTKLRIYVAQTNQLTPYIQTKLIVSARHLRDIEHCTTIS